MAKAILYCDKCGRMIRPSESENGDALVTDSTSLCPQCAAGLSPEERAALTGAPTPPARDRLARHRPPAAEAAPPERPAATRTQATVFVAALVGGGVFAFVLTFVVAGPGDRLAPSRELPRPVPVSEAAPGPARAALPPPPGSGLPQPERAADAGGAPAAPPAEGAAEGGEPGGAPAVGAGTPPEETPPTPEVAAAPVPVPPKPAEKPAPPPRVVPTFPAIMTPEELEAWNAYERTFALLAEGDLDGAGAEARGPGIVTGKALAAVVTRARALRASAEESLKRSPPEGVVRLTWKGREMKGRISRIDGSRAWINMKNMEMPVDVSALPPEVFVSALGLDPKDPKSRADRATVLLALGAVEEGLSAAGRLGPEDVPELAEVIARRAALGRLKRFADGVAEVERLVKEIKPQEAFAALAGLKKDFPDLAGGPQGARLAYLAERADAVSAVKRLEKALAGKIVRAEEDMTVELRYDFAADAKGAADFTGSVIRTDAAGMHVKSIPHWERKPGQVNGVVYRVEFRPGTLAVEYLIQSSRHDIVIANVGHSQIKMRWIGNGEILFTYEPVFTGDVFKGANWKHPSMDGTYRYAFERTPEGTRFLLDGEERARTPAPPQPSPDERTWGLHIEANADFVLKEMVVRGRVDDAWLRAAAPAE